MIDFLFEYGMFLAKAITVVVSIGIVLILIFGLSRKAPSGSGLIVEKLNDKYREMADVLQQAMLVDKRRPGGGCSTGSLVSGH